MRFYRVSYSVEFGNSAGFSWHTSRADAERAARQAVRDDPREYREHTPEVDAIEVTPTRAGILAALRRYADHPDNG